MVGEHQGHFWDSAAQLLVTQEPKVRDQWAKQRLSHKPGARKGNSKRGNGHCLHCTATRACRTLCDPNDCSTPGFPVLYHLPEFAQSHVHWVHNASPFSSYPQPFPVLGSFPMSQVFASGGQSIGASALVLPMSIQGWFPLGLTGLISFLFKGLSRVFSSTTVLKISILQCSAFFMIQISHLYMTTWKTRALNIWTFVSSDNRHFIEL